MGPQDIIGRFPDLMEGFNRFLARCETMDAVDNEMRGQFGSQRGISQREMARLKGVSARWGTWSEGRGWVPHCGVVRWWCSWWLWGLTASGS